MISGSARKSLVDLVWMVWQDDTALSENMTNPGLAAPDVVPSQVGSSKPLGVVSEQTHKYLQVEITRMQGTLVFLKVPKDFDSKARGFKEILKAAAVETCDEYDWDSHGWEDTVEWQSIKEAPEAEAQKYDVYTLPEQ